MDFGSAFPIFVSSAKKSTLPYVRKEKFPDSEKEKFEAKAFPKIR